MDRDEHTGADVSRSAHRRTAARINHLVRIGAHRAAEIETQIAQRAGQQPASQPYRDMRSSSERTVRRMESLAAELDALGV